MWSPAKNVIFGLHAHSNLNLSSISLFINIDQSPNIWQASCQAVVPAFMDLTFKWMRQKLQMHSGQSMSLEERNAVL